METKEKNKKYSVILGIMILLFLIIVGIAVAWGLGYIHFGNKVEKNKEDNNIEQNVTNSNNENKEEEEKSDGQNNKKDNATLVAEAYKKYNLDWANKKYYETLYIKDGKIKVKLDSIEQEIKFHYGKPVVVESSTYMDMTGIIVINDNNEAYISNELVYINENGPMSLDVSKISFTKMNFKEKIVDVSLMVGDAGLPYSGPYFMTETGNVVNKEGKTYEEINKDHIYAIHFVDSPLHVYMCEDSTLDVHKINNEFIKVVNLDNEIIKAKKIFLSSADDKYIFYIIDETESFYMLREGSVGVAVDFDDAYGKVKNIDLDKNKAKVKITFTSGETREFLDLEDGFDLELKQEIKVKN